MSENLLGMRAGQHRLAVANVAEHYCGFAVSPVHVERLVVRCQYLNLATLDAAGINKDAATVVIRHKSLRHSLFKGARCDPQRDGPGPPLALVLEAFECAASASPGKKG